MENQRINQHIQNLREIQNRRQTQNRNQLSINPIVAHIAITPKSNYFDFSMKRPRAV
jgi:hypothetical protein